MKFKTIALLVVVTAIAVPFIARQFRSKRPLHIAGRVDPKFKSVEDVFRANLETGMEREGAMFAAYHNGKLVVDLYGGYMDAEAIRPWSEDTVSVAFSSTKAVCALIVAMLVERGQLDYDSLVTRYWPEFGQNGKENVTVAMLLSHQAGLAAIDTPITYETCRDWKKMSKVFEEQKPNWPPGTAYGYHALTFGWLVDQLVRRVDPKRRSVGAFLKEEITHVHDIDFSIGLAKSEWHRKARVYLPTAWSLLDLITSPEFIYSLYKMSGENPLLKRAFSNPQFVNLGDTQKNAWNDPELYSIEMAAANGVGTARALARIFSLVVEKRLLNGSDELLRRLHEVRNTGDCQITRMAMPMGLGFLVTTSPTGSEQIGHPGYGGQNVKLDVKHGLAFSYIRNGLGHDIGELTRTFMALQEALYQSLGTR